VEQDSNAIWSGGILSDEQRPVWCRQGSGFRNRMRSWWFGITTQRETTWVGPAALASRAPSLLLNCAARTGGVAVEALKQREQIQIRAKRAWYRRLFSASKIRWIIDYAGGRRK